VVVVAVVPWVVAVVPWVAEEVAEDDNQLRFNLNKRLNENHFRSAFY
jgi:hypothetical protein